MSTDYEADALYTKSFLRVLFLTPKWIFDQLSKFEDIENGAQKVPK